MVIKLFKNISYTFIVLISFNTNAALINGSVLNFNAYGGASIPASGNGSWFGADPTIFGVIGISSFDGLIVGTTQIASGSHIDAPDGSELPTIDNPHVWFGDTGMLSTTSNTGVLSAMGNSATIDFTGMRWSWAGADNIVIYDVTVGDTGIANIICALDCGNGDTYTLDYLGHTEQGGPFGGVEVRIHLEGTISAVPIPAALWLFSTGLIGLVGFSKRNAIT